jgi:hypothetical protein
MRENASSWNSNYFVLVEPYIKVGATNQSDVT